ncbi:hypothetical protein YPPY66_1340, partial [Yersinia pestis PY-66]
MLKISLSGRRRKQKLTHYSLQNQLIRTKNPNDHKNQ